MLLPAALWRTFSQGNNSPGSCSRADRDTLTKDDFLGEVKVDLNSDMPVRTDEWFRLSERPGETRGVTGEVRIVIEDLTSR